MRPQPPSTDARPSPRGGGFTMYEKIDVCRGLFAFLVVVAHAFELSSHLDPDWAEPLPWAVRNFLGYGSGTGIYYVMGFFVLSGYCIQASVSRLAGDGRFPLKTYLTARATRILPLYYLALIFAVGVEFAARTFVERPSIWGNGISRPVLACQLLLIQNFTQTFGSYAPSWSITNEAAYYLMFGLLAAACVPLRVRPAVVGMGLCVGVGAALQLVYRAGMRTPAVLGTGLLFGLGVNWFLGALVYEHRASLGRYPLLRRVAPAWPLVLALSITMWCCQRVHQEFVFMTSGVAFTLMLVHFTIRERDKPPADRRPPRRWVELMGLVSYPTYLFHGPILLAVGAGVKASGIAVAWWAFWPAATLFAIACCLPLGPLLEQPIMTWRAGVLRRLKEADSRRAATAGARPALDVQQ